MPIPKPTDNETEDEFLQRCMGNDLMNDEYPESDQRYAVCLTQWENRDKWRDYPMERKEFKFEIKEVNEEEGVLDGYGSTFDTVPDAYGDIVDQGAFTKTIKENGDNFVSLFNHDVNLPIGKPEVSEDKKGLLTHIKLVKGVQKADEVLLLAKAGVIKKFSIGYDVVKADVIKGIRHLKEVKLYDISPVVFAANNNAEITAVKSELDRLLKSGRVLSSSSRSKVEAAVDALQALLDSTEEDEPSKDTLPPEEDKEAAEMEAVLAGIEAEIEGVDVKAAEARIDQFIKNLEDK